MTEQGVPGAPVKPRADRRVAGVEAVSREQQEQAGGVATADLQPVERRERLLDGNQHVEPRVADAGRRKGFDLGGRPQAVAAKRPLGVREGARRPADTLQTRVAEPRGAGVQRRLQPLERLRAWPRGFGHRGAQRRIPHQGTYRRPGAQLPVPARKLRGGAGEGRGKRLRIGAVHPGDRRLRRAACRRKPFQQFPRTDRRSGVGAHQDANDPAHGRAKLSPDRSRSLLRRR